MIDGSRRRSVFGALALVGCLDACSDRERFESELGREVAERLCSIQTYCDCDPDRLIPECEAEVEREVSRNEREAISRGLVFDPDCVQLFLESIDELSSCRTSLEGDAVGCFVYFGTADEGDLCKIYELYPVMTDCRPGLSCRQGACRDLENPTVLMVGETCSDAQGAVPSGFLGECAEGLVCDSSDTLTCTPYTPIPKVPMGGECIEWSSCENGSYCRPPEGVDDISEESPGICTAPTPAGEPCSLSYECDRFCEDGFCQVPPPLLCDVLQDWQSSRELLNGSAAP